MKLSIHFSLVAGCKTHRINFTVPDEVNENRIRKIARWKLKEAKLDVKDYKLSWEY